MPGRTYSLKPSGMGLVPPVDEAARHCALDLQSPSLLWQGVNTEALPLPAVNDNCELVGSPLSVLPLVLICLRPCSSC